MIRRQRAHSGATSKEPDTIGGAPIDRDIVIVPPIWVEDFDADVATSLRPAFDSVWRASGFAGSPNYDNNGRWVG
jgi:hypothetical protein